MRIETPGAVQQEQYMDRGSLGATQQEEQMVQEMMRGAASAFGSGAGAYAAREAERQQADYIDPPLQGMSTPWLVTYEQYWRLKKYEPWDGDMRWPHPQFTKDETERATNYNNRLKVGYLRDQAEISAYERQIAENQAALKALTNRRPETKPPRNQQTRPDESPLLRDFYGRR